MDRTIKSIVWALGLGLGARLLGWGDVFHAAWGAVALALLAVVILYIRRRRAAGDDPGDESGAEERLPDGSVRSAMFGAAWAAVCVMLLAVWFAGLKNVPWVYPGYYDRDRGALEAKILTLEEAGDAAQASAVIEQRLGGPLTDAWESALVSRLYHDLVAAAEQCTTLQLRADYLRRAQRVAKQHALDAHSADAMLEGTARQLDFEASVTSLRKEQKWEELVTLLRGSLIARTDAQPGNRSQSDHSLEHWAHEAWLAWGDSIDDLQQKREKYQHALEIAKQYKLNPNTVASRIHVIDMQLAELARIEAERNRPFSLPRGAQAGLGRISTDNYPPVLILHIWVEDAQGAPILGLKEKDFSVSFAGAAPASVVLAPFRQTPPPLAIALAIDVSNSMTGSALEFAKRGANTFLRGLNEPDVEVLPIAFDDRVRHCCEWTADLSKAVASVQTLQAQGNTALLQTLAEAANELARRQGDRHLLVFTDGQDTVGGANLAAIVSQCQRDKVTVHAIGLRTSALDAGTLQRLANETGGRYVEAQRAEDLVDLYRLTARQIRRSLYRLAITPSPSPDQTSDSTAIEVQVGGKDGITVQGTALASPAVALRGT